MIFIMKTGFGIFLLFIAMLMACNPVPLSNAEMVEKINEQATEMGTALMKKDFEKVVDFSYPELIKQAGGKGKMVEAIEKGVKKTELAGNTVVGVTFGEPSAIIQEADELQCTLSQQTTLKTPGGNSTFEATLIAISKDEGHHWTFLEVHDQEFFVMQASFPNLSSRLKLPGSAQEIFNDTITVR
jgi:hypothetical protein